MKLIAGSEIEKVLENKYILLDSDFLGKLYEDVEFLGKFLEISSKSHLWLDQMVSFEFLRDVFDPKYEIAKSKFLNGESFNQTTNHQSIFKEIQENALLLSKIYAHKGKSKGVSTTDLYLAARILLFPESSLLITGNRKDYPSCVFDLISIIGVENKKDESIACYSVLQFNYKNFNKCCSDLSKVKQ